MSLGWVPVAPNQIQAVLNETRGLNLPALGPHWTPSDRIHGQDTPTTRGTVSSPS
jgi:hypothetical protein